MTQKEALEEIRERFPDFTEEAEQMLKDGENLVQYLSVLRSFA